MNKKNLIDQMTHPRVRNLLSIKEILFSRHTKKLDFFTDMDLRGVHKKNHSEKAESWILQSYVREKTSGYIC